jgi:glucan endo-1,3-alpha-glucosidase
MNPSTIPGSVTSANIVNAVETYANNPNYFRYNGHPLLNTFSGEGATDSTNTTPAAWWTNEVLTPLRTAGINTFFVPGFQPVAPGPVSTSQSSMNTFASAQVADSNSFVQGLMTWEVISVVLDNDGGRNFAVPLMNAYTSALNAFGKVFMLGINTKYWGSAQPTNGNIYYEWQGGANMDAQWGAAVTNNVPWVEILTWNDPNESYMMPMDDFEKYNNWGNARGWWKPSFGYAEMLRYYIAWFRTGVRPTITKDAVIWFYRTHPAAATATSTSTPNGVTTGPVTRFIPNSPTGAVPANADQIYTTVFATAPGTVSINGTSQPVVAGVNQLSTPFVAGPAPTFSLSRNGTTVLSGTGADAILAHPPYYDWWNSSGFVEGP